MDNDEEPLIHREANRDELSDSLQTEPKAEIAESSSSQRIEHPRGETEEPSDPQHPLPYRAPKNIRRSTARSIALLWASVNIPFCFAIVSLQLCQGKHLYSGELAEMIIMVIYYMPSAIFCITVPFLFPSKDHEPLGSMALRGIHSVISVIYIVNEIATVLICIEHSKCNWEGITQRFIGICFFFGLAVYVLFNNRYPRNNGFHLLCHLHLCSAAIYTYVVELAQEEHHIYKQMFDDNHTHLFENQKGGIAAAKMYRFYEEQQDNCNDTSLLNFLACLLEDCRVMIPAVTLESLVVSICIIIAIIHVVGEKEEHETAVQTEIVPSEKLKNTGETHQDNTFTVVEIIRQNPHSTTNQTNPAPQNVTNDESRIHKMRLFIIDRINKARIWVLKHIHPITWIVIILISLISLFVTVGLNVWKADPDDLTPKLIYAICHDVTLLVGIIACIWFFCKGSKRNTNNGALEVLDMRLLSFGTIGIFTYIGFGLVHSFTLFASEYDDLYAFLCFSIYLFSFLEVAAQTVTIQYRDIAHSSHVYPAAIMLWFVNFTMFSLDLFDAATFGYYVTPIAEVSSKEFALIVRALGPFNVFYRFHSLSLIAESIEHHIRLPKHDDEPAQGTANPVVIERTLSTAEIDDNED